LALLRQRFDGLVTYSCANGLDQLARLAHEAGFRALVLGVWSPSDSSELERALAAAGAEPEIVIGLAIGNEGLFFGHYDTRALARRGPAWRSPRVSPSRCISIQPVPQRCQPRTSSCPTCTPPASRGSARRRSPRRWSSW